MLLESRGHGDSGPPERLRTAIAPGQSRDHSDPHGQHQQVRAEFEGAPQHPPAAPHPPPERHHAHAGQRHEDRRHRLHRRRIEVPQTAGMVTESPRGDGREGVAERIERTHAGNGVSRRTQRADGAVDDGDPAELCPERRCRGTVRKAGDVAGQDQRRNVQRKRPGQQSQRRKSPEPLRQRPPEEHGRRQRLELGQHAEVGGTEPGDRLEDGIGQRSRRTGQEVGRRRDEDHHCPGTAGGHEDGHGRRVRGDAHPPDGEPGGGNAADSQPQQRYGGRRVREPDQPGQHEPQAADHTRPQRGPEGKVGARSGVGPLADRAALRRRIRRGSHSNRLRAAATALGRAKTTRWSCSCRTV